MAGEKYTGYECTQKQRQYETAIRRAKDTANALKAAGDVNGARTAQKRVRALNAEYRAFSEHVGLKPKIDRTKVEGYNERIQVKNALGQTINIAQKNQTTGTPNSITQVVSKKGGTNRNYYDADGLWCKQISNYDHGNAKQHAYGKSGEHAHDIIWKDGEIVGRPARELTEDERKENADIL